MFKTTTHLKMDALVSKTLSHGGVIFHLSDLTRLKWAGFPSAVACHLTGACPCILLLA